MFRSMRSYAVVSFLAVVLTIPAAQASFPDSSTAAGFLFKELRQNNRDYKYTVYVPRNYDPARKWPLIVFLHGAGECGTDGVHQITQGIGTAVMADPDRWPFLIVFPQKPQVSDAWENHDDAVMAMLRKTMVDYSVDPARLYLTGISQGGHGTWAIGSNHADLWAAIAPICGYGGPGIQLAALKTMPIWCFHGEADTAVSVGESRALVGSLRGLGSSAKLTTYPGVGHNSWDRAYRQERLSDWFLEHRRQP